MHDARYLLSHLCTAITICDSGRIRPKDNSTKGAIPMANVLTTGALFSAPTKKPSFFARLLRAHVESSERRAGRVVEEYIATHGMQKLSDDAERQIGRLYAKAGQ
jgi:hypothetical protein